MISDMVFMHELRGIFSAQYFGSLMALETLALWDMAISLHDIEMTFLTSHPSGNVLSMIEIPAFDFNIPFGLNVARSTTTHSTRNAFLLPPWASPVIMTGEAVGFVDGEVHSLNNLCVAGGASKFYSPSQLT
jgi:hypothetical protein